MRLLVLGGTGWLGGTVAAQAVASGHDVTCVARGEHAPVGATLVRADRELDDALAGPATEHWDAVVDVATQPVYVRRAVRDLAPVATKYIHVSSVSAYADQAESGADETAPLFTPLTADAMRTMVDYGPAKAACEQAVRAAFPGDRHAIVRPGLIGGPGDRTGRTTYWPRRFAHPSNPRGRVLVPDAAEQPTAVIDVRDLAGFILALAAGDGSGAFNVLGAPLNFGEHVAVARRVAAHAGTLAPAAAEWLHRHDVAEWMGPRSLPLWLTGPEAHGMNTRSCARALAAGLDRRPLAETLADVLAADGRTVEGAGLTDDEERELLVALDTEAGPPRR